MSKFEDFYSKKSVAELLEKLKAARVSPATMDKEWGDALVTHLNERKLSIEEKKMMEKILTTDLESLKADSEMEAMLSAEKAKTGGISSVISGEGGRYTALKTVVGLLSFLGYVVIIIGTGALIFFATQGTALMGFVALVVSIVIALPLLAYANLIYVFIDIEHNTRKTKEAITQMNK